MKIKIQKSNVSLDVFKNLERFVKKIDKKSNILKIESFLINQSLVEFLI
mgnify:CR=1 FL=1